MTEKRTLQCLSEVVKLRARTCALHHLLSLRTSAFLFYFTSATDLYVISYYLLKSCFFRLVYYMSRIIWTHSTHYQIFFFSYQLFKLKLPTYLIELSTNCNIILQDILHVTDQ